MRGAPRHQRGSDWIALVLLGCSTCAREAPPDRGSSERGAQAVSPRQAAQDAMDPEENTLRVRPVAQSHALNGAAVEIVVRSPRFFPAGGAMPILKIGTQEISLSRYPPDGDLHTLIFTVAQEQFDAIPEGEPAFVQYGSGEPAGVVWSFGPLKKAP